MLRCQLIFQRWKVCWSTRIVSTTYPLPCPRLHRVPTRGVLHPNFTPLLASPPLPTPPHPTPAHPTQTISHLTPRKHLVLSIPPDPRSIELLAPMDRELLVICDSLQLQATLGAKYVHVSLLDAVISSFLPKFNENRKRKLEVHKIRARPLPPPAAATACHLPPATAATCHLSPVTCRLPLHVTCRLSLVALSLGALSPVTCRLSLAAWRLPHVVPSLGMCRLPPPSDAR